MSDTAHPAYLDRQPEEAAAMLVLGVSGQVLTCTHGVEGLTGRPAGELQGLPVAELLAERDAWPRLARRAATGPAAVTTGLRHTDGKRARVRITAFPLPEGGEHRFLVHLAPADLVRRQEEDQAMVRALFTQTRVGLVIHDEDLRIVRVNRGAEARTGRSLPVLLAEVLEPADAAAVEEQLLRVAATGEPLIDWEHSARLREAPDADRMVSVSAFRLQDAHGGLMGVAGVFSEITEQHLARRRFALLHAAAERIGASLDVGSNADELARVLVPDLADLVSVDIAEAVFDGGDPGAVLVGSRLRRAAAVSADGRWPPEVHPVGAVFRIPGMGGPSGDLRQGQPLRVPDMTDMRRRLSGDEEHSRLMLPDAATSVMVLPLIARGQLLGAVGMWRTGERPPFSTQDAELAQEIGSRAALSVDNSRQYTRERQTLESLQRSLLPQPVSEMSAAETAGSYVPAGTAAGIGGSWFDVIPLSSTRVAFVIGDVAGHGLSATATMGRLRTAVQTLADLDLTPEELLTRLDDLAIRLTDTEPQPTGLGSAVVGATCLYCVYDPVSGHCVMASAGRLPPVIARPGQGAVMMPARPGPPLGVGGTPFEAVELDLEPGSLLVFFSDELVADGGRGAGGQPGGSAGHGRTSSPAGASAAPEGLGGPVEERVERLCARVSAAAARQSPPAEVGQAVLGELLAEQAPSNDVSLLVARVRTLQDDATADWQFPAEPAVVARAREVITGRLTDWGLETTAFATELIVSELVTNAIRYAGGPVGLRLIRDETLICEVSDPSETQPHLRRARPTDEGGRGLFLVAQLSHRWGSRYTPTGKTIWTEQLLEPS